MKHFVELNHGITTGQTTIAHCLNLRICSKERLESMISENQSPKYFDEWQSGMMISYFLSSSIQHYTMIPLKMTHISP